MSAPTSDGLSIRDIVVAFGGEVAVNGLSLDTPRGRIAGLIGPNGAGKTTTFDVCSGLLRPQEGKTFLDGADVSGLDASARARRGLGRTFQRMKLFDSMTVRENVALGREAALAGAGPLRQVLGKRAQRTEVEAAAADALAMCGLEDLRDVGTATLSTGKRRLVELARVLAGQFTTMLLDEPSSGLDRNETRAFGGVLRRAVEERGTGILLVEHDMSLVMDISDYVYVMDFGQLIFEGHPAEVARSELVQRAYLGTVLG